MPVHLIPTGLFSYLTHFKLFLTYEYQPWIMILQKASIWNNEIFPLIKFESTVGGLTELPGKL